MDQIEQFREKLRELASEAKAAGGHISEETVRSALAEAQLGEEQMEMVLRYLKAQGIAVTDAAPGTGPAGDSAQTEEQRRALALYLEEVGKIQGLAEAEELALFHAAADGAEDAQRQLAEQFLPTVLDLAAQLEDTGGSAEEYGSEDLIQEGNIALLCALRQTARQENLAAYRVHLLNAVAGFMQEYLRREAESRGRDTELLERMNRLHDAMLTLEEEMGRTASLEELSAFLDRGEDELDRMLRLAGSES